MNTLASRGRGIITAAQILANIEAAGGDDPDRGGWRREGWRDPHIAQRIRELAEAGHVDTAIANELGVHQTTATGWRTALNIPRNRRHP